MSDLCLVAAMLARINTLDQPSTTDPELPVLGSLSGQMKHQSLTPVALKLHQASLETYAAEFSQGQRSSQAPRSSPGSDLASETAPGRSPLALTISPPQIQAPELAETASPLPSSLAIGTTSTQHLAARLRNPLERLGLRPLIDRKGGGSIAALPSAARPLALKLHQASIETYAQAIAQAPVQPPGQPAPLADSSSPARQSPAKTALTPATTPAIASAPAAPALSPGASLTAATQALGMAQAAGAAGAWQALRQTPGSSIAPQQPSAAQAAIALDQQVRQAHQVQHRQAEDLLVAQAMHYPVAQPGCREAQQLALGAVGKPGDQPIPQSPAAQPLTHQSPGYSAGYSAGYSPSDAASRPLAPSLTLAVAPSDRAPIQPLPWSPGGPLGSSQAGPRSGPQLYQQRWAALKQGQLYSRLPSDSFRSLWGAVQQQPSYSQWKQLLALEARAAGRGQGSNRLSVVLGDSLSLWLPMQQLPSSQLWLNQGISGDTTRGILQRLDSLTATRPSSIYLMAGVNDLKNGASDAEVLNNLQQIIRQLRRQHPQAKVYVQSILPAAIASPPGRIRSINQRLGQLARAERVSFIDLYPQFAGPNDQLLADLTTDGIHLSPQGYSLWQSVLRNLETWAGRPGPSSSS